MAPSRFAPPDSAAQTIESDTAMIVSHKYKFIFIKTNKTAGTSIEIGLSKYCGPDDIVTPITPEDEEIRKRQGFPGPRNCYQPLEDYSYRDVARFFLKGEKKLRFYNHMPAVDIKRMVGDDVWNNYFKFCVERNPWDRFVSLYYWDNRRWPRTSMKRFIDRGKLKKLKRRGRDLYTIGGKIVVDKICLFENLVDELEAVRRYLDIPRPIELPWAKASYRKDTRRYREIVAPYCRARVESMFADEIADFDYRW